MEQHAVRHSSYLPVKLQSRGPLVDQGGLLHGRSPHTHTHTHTHACTCRHAHTHTLTHTRSGLDQPRATVKPVYNNHSDLRHRHISN